MSSVRAKFRCSSVEQSSSDPTEVQRYNPASREVEPSGQITWPRTFRFTAVYDPDVPEDVRYAQATPVGELRIQVDNPSVIFEPGRSYYLDFTPVDEPAPGRPA